MSLRHRPRPGGGNKWSRMSRPIEEGILIFKVEAVHHDRIRCTVTRVYPRQNRVLKVGYLMIPNKVHKGTLVWSQGMSRYVKIVPCSEAQMRPMKLSVGTEYAAFCRAMPAEARGYRLEVVSVVPAHDYYQFKNKPQEDEERSNAPATDGCNAQQQKCSTSTASNEVLVHSAAITSKPESVPETVEDRDRSESAEVPLYYEPPIDKYHKRYGDGVPRRARSPKLSDLQKPVPVSESSRLLP